jgi:hypothetical protein
VRGCRCSVTTRTKHRVAGLAALALAAPLGCTRSPIAWEDARRVSRADGLRTLGLDAATHPVPMPRALPASLERCDGSAVYSHLARGEAYAAWWRTRRDSTVALVVQHSADSGATWSAPVEVDKRDLSRGGCARPAPSIWFDAPSASVHLAYSLAPAAGAGVWEAHAMPMDTTAASRAAPMWHPPSPVIFGDRLVRTAVASAGHTVVVAFQYPNASAPRLGVAVSTVDGHGFAPREIVSGEGAAVSDPFIALDGTRVTVLWSEYAIGSDSTSGWMMRRGALR